MSFQYTKGIFKICVAQICQNIGWHTVHSSTIEILVDVLHRYLLELSKTIHKHSNQHGRTEPNLHDVESMFKELRLNLVEMEEYVTNVEPVPFAHQIPAIPLEHPMNLQHPKSGSREIHHRPDYIHEYFPLMHPDLEEEDGLSSPSFEGGSKKSVLDNSVMADGETPSPLSSPKHGVKRPGDWTNDMPVNKKMRHYVEEEGRPMREVTSVFMTPTGFISPAREGKAPEPSMPHNMDSPPSTPERPSTPDIVVPRKESKSKDTKKDKSSKSKKDKDKEVSKKDSKKAKSSKKEKENKENTALASEKSVATSSSSKKDHTSSHKSSSKSEKSAKSKDDSSQKKSKSEKAKERESKDDHKKSEEHSRSVDKKSKSKSKHSSPAPSRPSKVTKIPRTPPKPAPKSPKKSSSKSPKFEKKASPSAAVAPAKKEEYVPLIVPKIDAIKMSRMDFDDDNELSDYLSREGSPQPLVIDTETQNQRDRENRIADLDECINAVIQRAQEETKGEVEKSHISLNKTIDDVARGPVMRRLEPKDIYDFTDSSELSSLSSLEADDVPMPMPGRKERSKSSDSERSSDSSYSKKPYLKAKHSKKKRGSRRSDSLNKSPNVIVQRAERSPSPIKLKDGIFSSDDSDVSRSPSPENFFDIPRTSQKHRPHSPSSSNAPSTSFSNSPFAPVRQSGHLQSNPHFPTPPLFQTSSKAETTTRGDSQPLNLAKSSTLKSPKFAHEGKSSDPYGQSSGNKDDLDLKKGKIDSDEKDARSKPHHKDKKEKKEKEKVKKKSNKDKKEKQKGKEKKEVESPKLKEKVAKKNEPVVKEERRGRPPKSGKKKDKEDKDDSSVPKFTLKIAGSAPGSGKFVIRPSSKSSEKPSTISASKVRSPSPQPIRAADSPPPSPAPPKADSPPPSSAPSPTPPPSSESNAPTPGPSVSPSGRGAHSRGRGRGRKPANPPILTPQTRTVITETLGTIMDESGNKIWICPACTRPDDGSAMIGCDECDDWYHWVCVGIVVPPKEEESWFCVRCVTKRQSSPAKRRRKKHRKDK